MSACNTVQLPPDLQRAKAAFKRAVAAAGGQIDAGKAAGRNQSQISHYTNENTDAFAPLDVVLAIENVTRGTPGHPHVTRFLALEAGFGLFKLPGEAGAGTIWAQHGAAIAKEANEVVSKLCLDLADGDVDPREAKRLLPDVDEAIEALVALRESLKQRAEDPR